MIVALRRRRRLIDRALRVAFVVVLVIFTILRPIAAGDAHAYWAVDLDSTNGMEVNGHRQKRAKLRQGDRITVGSTELVFRREAEEP